MTTKIRKAVIKVSKGSVSGAVRVGRKQATGRGGARDGAGRKAMTGKRFLRASAQLTKEQMDFLTEQGAYVGADGKKRNSVAVGIRRAVEFYQASKAKPQPQSQTRKKTVKPAKQARRTTHKAAPSAKRPTTRKPSRPMATTRPKRPVLPTAEPMIAPAVMTESVGAAVPVSD